MGQMELYGISLTKLTDRGAERAEQDQTARMYRLILIYTVRKITPSSRMTVYG